MYFVSPTKEEHHLGPVRRAERSQPKTRDERYRIMEHLEKFGLCLAFINTLMATVDLLDSTNTLEPPSTLQDRIRANLPLDENQKQRLGRRHSLAPIDVSSREEACADHHDV